MSNQIRELIDILDDNSGSSHRTGAASRNHTTNIYEPGSLGQKQDNQRGYAAMLLQGLHSEYAVNCYGGRLFRFNHSDREPLICFAVKNMSQSEIDNAVRWYDRCGRMGTLGMIHRAGRQPVRVEDYTIFEFEIGPQEYSLNERMRSGAPFRRDCLNVMQKLVQFLYDYRNELRKIWRQGYTALNCLSKETIFFDSDGQMRILPLLAHRGCYPIEIPIEVKAHADGDERSDLYSAAYVAVEIFSSSRPGKGLHEPDSPLIKECLKSIRDWRPTLNEVYNAIGEADVMPVIEEEMPYNEDEPHIGASVKAWFQSIKKWVQSLTAPYDVEGAENDFQMDSTFDKNQVSGFGRHYDFRKGSDDPDGTFH